MLYYAFAILEVILCSHLTVSFSTSTSPLGTFNRQSSHLPGTTDCLVVFLSCLDSWRLPTPTRGKAKICVLAADSGQRIIPVPFLLPSFTLAAAGLAYSFLHSTPPLHAEEPSPGQEATSPFLLSRTRREKVGLLSCGREIGGGCKKVFCEPQQESAGEETGRLFFFFVNGFVPSGGGCRGFFSRTLCFAQISVTKALIWLWQILDNNIFFSPNSYCSNNSNSVCPT